MQTAYDVLSDAENRKLYDQYGENWRAVKAGAAPPPPGWEEAQAGGGTRAQTGDFDFNLQWIRGERRSTLPDLRRSGPGSQTQVY